MIGRMQPVLPARAVGDIIDCAVDSDVGTVTVLAIESGKFTQGHEDSSFSMFLSWFVSKPAYIILKELTG
jgi:hypothetical protein